MITSKKIIILCSLGVLLFFIQSCQSNIIYNKYESLDNSEWKENQLIKFEIPIQDTVNVYNLYINLRNTNKYRYSNLFLIAQMTFPDQAKVVDTLEYEMTDAEGKFLGSGFSDIKENKFFYKYNVRFKKSGMYQFQVKQAMRKRNEIDGIETLDGVSDVGLSIEKIK